jgi:hypothetical protein
MKFIYIVAAFTGLTLISCSGTISTSKKEYQLTENSQIESDWKFDPQEWSLEDQTFSGSGSAEHWAVITSKKQLPENYEITYSINLSSGNLVETMLNFDKQNYIRTYLYNIDQNIVIGRGIYNKKSDEYDKRGGPTLLNKPFNFSSNTWHKVKIQVLNKKLLFVVNDSVSIECSLEKYNLSQKGKIGFLTNGKAKIKDLRIKNL